VRVKLFRINCDVSRSLPADGDRNVWIDRLKTALGSVSMDFLDLTLFQLQSAARLPNSGVSEIAVNSALAMIESEQPRNETECAIVVQMACVHAATMASLDDLAKLMAIAMSWQRRQRRVGYRALSRLWLRRCVG
jgi:hypothetical protein